ncbi:MAG: class I SAM-dependent methyltransferase [Nitrospirae bacterium]|nr:class I SAM-dependent methyltransferase [Nitrospirota bacterium]MBF0591486.1 class I SAM-dependent methyltransferase [Nitrospirota bacterium]
MPHCPWYIGYFLINPLRAFLQNPSEILAPYVRAGAVVFEPGPGMGFFTLELARLVGSKGHVYVSDIQPQMLRNLERRATKANVISQIKTRLVKEDSLGVDDLEGQVDFVLSFAVTHEMADIGRFFAETSAILKKGGCMLLAEPRLHVTAKTFSEELEFAQKHGLRLVAQPLIWFSRTALLEKD